MRIVAATTDEEMLHTIIGAQILGGTMDYRGFSNMKGFEQFRAACRSGDVQYSNLDYGFVEQTENLMLPDCAKEPQFEKAYRLLNLSDHEFNAIRNGSLESLGEDRTRLILDKALSWAAQNYAGWDLYRHLREELGMSNEECMFILHGKTTRNGKSTLLNTIEYMLGDYAKVAPVGMICRGDRQKDAEAASPTLAGLKGKRFVTMSESNEYGKLDEEKIKQLTGGEEISARALYQSAITYKPQFTLWLSCNDLPMVTDKSLFASQRIKVIEFNRHFRPEEQDTHLKDELTSTEAMSGIFMWLVRGYIKYKENGLKMAAAMTEVVTKYERDNDLVLQFLENRCVRNEDVNIKAKDLYNAFKLWAKSEGAYVLSARKFNSEMERHPEWFDRKSTSSGFMIYWGLKLKEVV